MYIDFNLLPGYARLWIYQANRKISAAEENPIRNEALSFCEQWEAHGQPLKTSYKIEQNQFLIFAVDEGFGGVSGCSIDGSVKMLKSLQDLMGLDFFDRSKAAFLLDGLVTLIPVAELKKAFASGTLRPDSLAFNSQVTTKEEWEKNWILAAEKTWLRRFLPKTSVA